MCAPKPKVDNTIQNQMLADAERARKDEEARAGRIRTGATAIDTQFAGFDTSFFNKFRDAHLNFNQPELDRQFGDAKDQLSYSLARAGTLNSSIAGDRLARLTGTYDTSRASMINDAENATAGLRANVNNEKSGLIGLLNATGDATRATNEALSRSQQLLQTQPKFNPLGDIFAGVAGAVGNYYQAKQARDIYGNYLATAPDGNTGAARIVGA